MQHGVPSVLGFLKVRSPLLRRSHPLGHNSEDSKTIERDVDDFVRENSPLARREYFEVLRKYSGSRLALEDRVDIEKAFAARYALAVAPAVFNPIFERTRMRYR